jgi:hypothetical protein
MPAPYPLTPEQKAILDELRKAFAEVHRAHQRMDQLAQQAVDLRTPWHEVANAIEATPHIVQTRYGKRHPVITEATTRPLRVTSKFPSGIRRACRHHVPHRRISWL